MCVCVWVYNIYIKRKTRWKRNLYVDWFGGGGGGRRGGSGRGRFGQTRKLYMYRCGRRGRLRVVGEGYNGLGKDVYMYK